MAKMGVIYDKDIKERVFALFSDMVSSPSSISFEGNSIVKNGVATRIIATLRDGLTLFAGETLNYQVKHGNTVLSSGSATTDNNGQIAIDYTGTALGKIDVIVKYRTLLQETFVVTDAQFYDKGLDGTGNHNDNWFNLNNKFTITRGSYTNISNNGTGYALLYANCNSATVYPFNTGICVEFELGTLSDDNNLKMFVIPKTDNSLQDFNVDLTSYANSHIKIEVTNQTIKLYVDDTLMRTANTSNFINNSFNLEFATRYNGTSIEYKEFKVYPI